MTVFVDASALVAMIGREPEAAMFADTLALAERRLSSAIALWEAVRGIARVRDIDVDEARVLVSDFVRAVGIDVVSIGADEAELALDAHRSFGKGLHPAALNMGDCFAYACTVRHDALILFKGDDFAQTDLKDALLA